MSAVVPPPGPMTVREMVVLGLRRRRLALIAFAVPPLAVAALLLVLPPQFRAQSDILVKTGREYMADVAGDNGLTAPTSTKQEGINSEIALLTSRTVVEATIRAIGITTLYPKLAADPPWFKSVEDAAVDRFRRDLTVEPIKLSNIIATNFTASSPALAERVLDRLIAIYIDKHTEIFASARTESYADAIQRTLAEVRRLEQERVRVKLAGGLYDTALQRAALITQRVAAQAHLQELENTAATLRQRLTTLEAARTGLPATTQSSTTMPNEGKGHIRQALIDLRVMEAAMVARFGPAHPDLPRVRGQITALDQMGAQAGEDRVTITTAPSALVQQIDSELVMDRAQLAPLPQEQARYRSLLEGIDQDLQGLERSDGQLRVIDARIAALNDDLKIAQARYGQARTQEQMDQARQVSVVQVAPALAPDRAAKPKKTLLVAASLLLGLLAGGIVVVLSIVTNTAIITEEGAERLLGLPVLMSLPLAMPKPGAPVTLPLQ
jgi:succinoglycan biosynthesis transport protein ExoP